MTISGNRTISFDGFFWIASVRKPRFFEDADVLDGLDPVEYIQKVRGKKRKKKRRFLFLLSSFAVFSKIF